MIRSAQEESQTAVSDTWDQVYQEANIPLAEVRLDRERISLRWRTFCKFLETHFANRTLQCVELGCGDGDLSVLLAEQGHQVTLVDFSHAALNQARQRFLALGLQENRRRVGV